MHTNRATPTSDAPSFLPLPPHTDDPEHQNLFVLLAILQSAPPTAKNQSGVVLLLSCRFLNSTSESSLDCPYNNDDNDPFGVHNLFCCCQFCTSASVQRWENKPLSTLLAPPFRIDIVTHPEGRPTFYGYVETFP